MRTVDALELEIYRELINSVCEACGNPCPFDASCQYSCEAFRIAAAIEILGLTEYWDTCLPIGNKEERAVCEFLEKLAEAKLK